MLITIMNATKMFRLGWRDLVKGAVTAVIAAVVVTLYGVVTQPGFDLFAADWNAIAVTAINAAFAGFFGYVGKNLLSDESGKLFGKI